MVLKALSEMEKNQRRAERESLKKQRELDRRRKETEKMEELERAKYETQVYENQIEVFTSMHKDCESEWNWDEILVSNPPDEPIKSSTHEDNALENLRNYSPGFGDKLLRRGDKKREELHHAVELAKIEDDNDYNEAIETYKQELVDWQMIHNFAERITSNDIEAYVETVEQLGSVNEISELGSQIQFRVIDTNLVEADLNVHDADVIPTEVKSVLKSGKLSVKQMPKTKYFGLYQDYVCSCAIRVAREVFSLLPSSMVIVTVLAEILNTKTGHLEEMPILSVAMPRATLEKLNFDMLDPSDSMENFNHNMKFMKTKGFNAVERIDPASLSL